jgi:Skp family chaperone for outer membrane proteins
MKTKQILLVAIAFICTSFSANAQRGVRIGYIDMEYILENVPEYIEASTQLDGKVQRWKADIDKKQQEIDLMKLTLTNERVLLTKELIEEREEEIKIKEDEMIAYQQNRFGSGGDLVIQRRQLVQPIQDQVFNIVQEVAEAKKYDFIFDKSADVVMLFAAKRNDISDIVLRSVNRVEKRKEASSKRERKEIEKRDDLSLEEDKEVTQREQENDAKQDAREQIMKDRKKERDSIRAAKKIAYDLKRAQLLETRQRTRDSIKAVRNGSPWPPVSLKNEGQGEKGEIQNKDVIQEKETSKSEQVKEPKIDPREQIMQDRKKERDSIKAAKKIAYDLRRAELLEARQRTRDSIQAIRNGTPWPPIPPKNNDQNQEATPPKQGDGNGK